MAKSGDSKPRGDRGLGPPGGPVPHIWPAHFVGRGSAPFSSELISPVLNGWVVSSHRKETDVFAGSDGRDRTTGLFAILRQNFIWGRQHVDTVRVRGAGPLRITSAPLGPKVVTWAQEHGNLRFVGKDGTHGTLHLKDDTVTINH